jgi:solute:Na+ symporter, SSS family
MTAFLALLALYFAAMLTIGILSSRRAGRSPESFYVADRSLGLLRSFAGLASTTTGGSTTIALAAYVMINGLAGLWLDLAGAVGLLVLGLGLAQRVRATGAITLPEIVGRFYGQTARVVAAVLVVCAEVVWFALLVKATQEVLLAAFGIPATGALVLSAGIFIAYTILGGQYAVVGTDVAQYAIMICGILLVGVPFALAGSNGLSGLPRSVLRFPTSPGVPFREVFSLLVLVGLPHLVGSDVYAKILSCRDVHVARRAALLSALSKAVFGAAVAVIALAARTAMAPEADAARTLPAALLHFAPAGLSAFILVALIATMQSSSDSVLLSATAATLHDVVPRWRTRPIPLATTRIVTAAYGLAGLAVALALGDLIEILKLGYSIFAAALILPILCGFFPRRLWLPQGDAVAAMIAGGATAAAGRLFLRHPGVDPVLLGTGLNALILAAAILRTRWLGRCPGDYAAELRPGGAEAAGRRPSSDKIAQPPAR